MLDLFISGQKYTNNFYLWFKDFFSDQRQSWPTSAGCEEGTEDIEGENPSPLVYQDLAGLMFMLAMAE